MIKEIITCWACSFEFSPLEPGWQFCPWCGVLVCNQEEESEEEENE